MPRHNQVPTTCTASLLTGWDLYHLLDTSNEKTRLQNTKKILTELKNDGYKLDFAIIHAFTTYEQIKHERTKEFIERIGFKIVLEGAKKGSAKREKGSGTLYLWATTPEEYQAGCEAFLKEVQDRLDIIDPPKKPDPARQKFPEIKIRLLADAGIVAKNLHPDNRMGPALLVTPKKAEMHIKLTYGVDPSKWGPNKDNWTNLTYRQLKTVLQNWKDELV